MIYGELFVVFFLIGLLCFGGGYAILPFIQDSVVSRNWLTVQEFADIIAVAESTPGPVSINTATFVGYKLAGLSGAAVATLALSFPAFILIVGLSKFLYSKRGEQVLNRILVGIKPVVAGMIFIAAWEIAKTVVFNENALWPINGFAAVLSTVAFVLAYRYKVGAIQLILVSMVLGIGYAYLF